MRVTFQLRLLPALMAGAFSAAASAEQTTTLAPVVVTGSRIEHSSFDLPASVDVIDAERIGEGQARVNASEALAGVPGLVVLNRQNYAQDLQISSRGFGARSAFGVRGVRLIADGIPATMPDGQGQAATFDLDAAERIEVLRGPYSAIYGNHAGGVIQLFTREGKDPANVEARILGGSFGTTKVDLSAQGKTGPFAYVIDTSRFDTDGYRDHSAATRDQSFARIDVEPNLDSKLTLLANALRQDNTQDALGLTMAQMQTNPKGVDPSAQTFNTRKSIDHLQGGATWEQRIGSQRIQVMAYTGTRKVTQYQSIPIATQNASAKNSGGVVAFNRDFNGVEARWIGQFDLGAESRLTTTAGIEYATSRDDRKGYNNFTGGATCGTTAVCGVIGTLRRNETDDVSNLDPYFQAEWVIGKWSLTAGLRHSIVRFDVQDKFLSNGNDGGKISYSASTPVIGALYQLTPAMNLYVSTGRGFETPTLNELFYTGAGNGFNFNLQAPTSRHYEGGIKTLLGESSRLNIALFQINTDNELVVDQSSGGRTSYKNASGTTRQGYEISMDTALGDGLTGRASYSQMSARYDDSFITKIGVGGVLQTRTVAKGNHLPGVPDRSLYGEVAWKSRDGGWGAAIETIGRSKIYVEDSNSFAPAAGFAIANLRLTAEQTQGEWKFNQFFRIDNLFDKAYVGSVIVADNNNRYYEPAPGRNWMIGAGMRYQFR